MNTAKELIERIDQWIEAHKEEIISDLQAFSRIRSVSRSDLAQPGAPFGPECRAMLDAALKRGAEYGFQTADHDGYCGSVYSGNLDNAIGFFGHLDVVPEGDMWIYPPYEATRVGDFLIGRGVGDNKSACVSGLALLRMFRDLDIPLKHGLRIIMGCAEETGMEDATHFEATQTMPVISIVSDAGFPVNYAQKGTLRGAMSQPLCAPILSFTGGEVENMVPPHAKAELALPTDEVSAVFAAMGYVEPDYRVVHEDGHTAIYARGVASHAASPENGKSAIYMLATALQKSGLVKGSAFSVMRAVSEMCSDFYGKNAGIDCEDSESGKTTMVIGLAKTRHGALELKVDCRLSIATDMDDVQRRFKDYCTRLGFSVSLLTTTRPFYMPKDDPRVLALMDVYQSLTGDMSPAYSMGGGTYSRCLKNALTYGPGFNGEKHRPDLPEHHGGAHAPDEFIYLPDMLKALSVYAVSIIELDGIV